MNNPPTLDEVKERRKGLEREFMEYAKLGEDDFKRILYYARNSHSSPYTRELLRIFNKMEIRTFYGDARSDILTYQETLIKGDFRIVLRWKDHKFDEYHIYKEETK